MDFSFSDEQVVLRELTRRILDERVTHEHLAALEAEAATVFDRELWAALADAGVLGAVVPEAYGGAGYGLLELLPVLEEVGRAVAPVPVLPTLVLGVLPIARFGTEGVRSRLLPGVVDGSVVLTAALEEPQVGARAGRLTGEAAAVPYAQHAARVVVPADGALWLVDPSSAGVDLTEQVPTNRQPLADLAFDDVEAELLTDDPAAVVWSRERAAAAACAVQVGVCEAAVALLAAHTSRREQFGKPIGSFQAVAHRAADAFIDTELLTLTARQAVFRLAMGWPATEEVHVAKFWAGDGGVRVVHAAQHLHGGLGVDTDYPLHRYFLWAKQLEHSFGTPTRELLRLGDLLAERPV